MEKKTMSREILFRAKRVNSYILPKSEQWVEGYLMDEIYINIPFNDEDVGGRFDEPIEIDPETVCEYTGLTDKNGRKIFENDICDRKEEFPEIVIYHDGDWTLDYSYASGKESGYNYCNLGFYVMNRGGVEVIGNIFDNPELLEGEDLV